MCFKFEALPGGEKSGFLASWKARSNEANTMDVNPGSLTQTTCFMARGTSAFALPTPAFGLFIQCKVTEAKAV